MLYDMKSGPFCLFIFISQASLGFSRVWQLYPANDVFHGAAGFTTCIDSMDLQSCEVYGYKDTSMWTYPYAHIAWAARMPPAWGSRVSQRGLSESEKSQMSCDDGKEFDNTCIRPGTGHIWNGDLYEHTFYECGVCRTCTVGKYSNASNPRTCSKCPSGQQPNSIATGCISCGYETFSNEILDTPSVCRFCPIGHKVTSDQTNCQICESNKGTSHLYQPLSCGDDTEDCSGDACVGVYAGCDDAMTVPGDTVVYHNSGCGYCSPGSELIDSVCVLCEAGKYNNEIMTNDNQSIPLCKDCPDGSNSLIGAKRCRLCKPGYQQSVGDTHCEGCPAGKFKATEGIHPCTSICHNGQYSPVGATTCTDCPENTYCPENIPPAGNGEARECISGQFSLPRSTVCDSCAACVVGKYMSNCRSGNGICEDCPECENKDEILVGCDFRGLRDNQNGTCKNKKYLSPTATCTDTVEGTKKYHTKSDLSSESIVGERNIVTGTSLMSGYGFKDIFGVAEEGRDGVDFMCSAMCDGEQKFDSMYCNGPYACKTQACAMETSAYSFLRARACPVMISEGDTDVQIEEKQKQKCSDCTKCGKYDEDDELLDGKKEIIQDWGRGCAQECSRILCDAGEIYDWTDTRLGELHRCKRCSELSDARLCTTANRAEHELATTDISGNRPLLIFDGCAGLHGKNAVTYGQCKRCTTEKICAAGTYLATCPEKAGDQSDAVCPACVPRDGMPLAKSSIYVDEVGVDRTAYCQVFACAAEEGDTFTGVRVDGAVCNRACAPQACLHSETPVSCSLPPPRPPAPRRTRFDVHRADELSRDRCLVYCRTTDAVCRRIQRTCRERRTRATRGGTLFLYGPTCLRA